METSALSQDFANLRARLEAAVSVDAPAKPERFTIATLAAMYHAHSERRFNGRHAHKELATIDQAMRPLIDLYGDMEPDAIRPLHLLAARQWWVEQGKARTTIQSRCQRWRKCWRWGMRRELLTRDLPEIDPLPFGHAKEPLPIQPVPIGLLERTIAVVSPIAGDMLNVLRLTGMRPGECCDLHSSEIDRSKPVWVFRPSMHKGRHRGNVREVFIGPQAQEIIGRHLRPGFIFITRTGKRWTEAVLYAAVRNACKKHGLPLWSPNMIRHAVATQLRESHGLDTAQAVLGHARIETTQVYALRRQQLASEAARLTG